MLKGRSLEVTLVTRNGKRHRINAEYPSALNGAWHDCELVYNGNTGEAIFTVDGRVLARRDDLAGGLAIGRGGADDRQHDGSPCFFRGDRFLAHFRYCSSKRRV